MTCSLFSSRRARRTAAIPSVLTCLLILAGLVTLPGCGGGRDVPKTGEVTGVVKLDGQPLSGAQVQFLPQAGRPSTAETGKDGSYRLQFTAEQEGALVGPHTVKIQTAVDGRDDPRTERLPARYHSSSELKADVKPGSNKLDFDLKSK